MISADDFYMRRRCKAKHDKTVFFHFLRKETRKDNKGREINGWYVRTQTINNERWDHNFMQDNEIEGFTSKTRYIKMNDGQVAKCALTGEISADFLQTIQE